MVDLFTLGHSVSLQEMLDGRELRAKLQKQMLSFCPNSSLICFTLNIAGPVKVSALTDEAFYAGIYAIEDLLASAGLDSETEIDKHEYGHEAYYVISEEDQSAEELKRLMLIAEEEHPLGRLFDIDVLRADGTKVSRTDIGYEARRCLICDKPASECASTRAHGVAELQAKTQELILDYIREDVPSEMISRMAYNSMMNEVATTPKPGLVDFANNGSHKDMTPETFDKSAEAICGYFGDCFSVGVAKRELIATELLEYIRPLGVNAEKLMLEATDGVNTHKGLIFSLGIIACAWGFHGGFDSERILATAGDIARQTDVEPRLEGRAGGARSEAASGFESVRRISLPAFRLALNGGADINSAGVYTLLKLVAELEDTNMISRGGKAKAEKMRGLASELATEFEGIISNADGDNEVLETCITLFMQKVMALDEAFIADNLSPGGAADLLAITYFASMIDELQAKKG